MNLIPMNMLAIDDTTIVARGLPVDVYKRNTMHDRSRQAGTRRADRARAAARALKRAV